MKKIHQINKGLIITNVVLGFTIYLGLLFLIPLGIAQIIMTFILFKNKSKLTKEISTLLLNYVIFTTIVLIIFLLIYFSIITSKEELVIALMVISVILAFFHLYITSLVNKIININ